MPLRAHLNSRLRQTGKLPPELEEVATPYDATYLLDYFRELDAQRTHNMISPNPITYSELMCWSILTRRSVTALEVEALMKLDMLFRKKRLAK